MFTVGDRVAVDGGTKCGTLRFLGPTRFRQGIWAGIELDEPEGKHGGTVEGIEYFKCAPLHGLFVHPSKLSLVKQQIEPTITAISLDDSEDHRNNLEKIVEKMPFATSYNTQGHLTPSRRVSLKKVLPFQTPIFSRPQGSTASILPAEHNFPMDNYLNNEKHSVSAMETELQRRQSELAIAKQALDAMRLQMTDPKNVGEYVLNRDRLLGAVDTYERALGRYERQMKRVSYILVRSEREKRVNAENNFPGENSKSGPSQGDSLMVLQQISRLEKDKEAFLQERIELVDKLEQAQQQAYATEDSVRKLEEQLEVAKTTQESLQSQIHQQASVAAGLNMERSLLRKEVGELRGKLASVLQGEKEQKDSEALQLVESLQDDNMRLASELAEKQDRVSRLTEELARLKTNHESVLKQTAEELEKINLDTNDAINQYQQQIEEKEAEVSRLKTLDNSKEITAIESEVELLRREKEISERQINLLQMKLLDHQDMAQLEAKHRAQMEALRQNLQDNWKRFTVDIAERDARIEELQEQLANLSRPTTIKKDGGTSGSSGNDESTMSSVAIGAGSSPGSGVQAIRSDVERMAGQLAELQNSYSELYRAKQSQERYLTHQIGKLKRRLNTQMKTVIDEVGQTTKGDNQLMAEKELGLEALEKLEAELSLVKEELACAKADKDQLRDAKQTELYSLQLRLTRALEEKDLINRQLEELQSQLGSRTAETEILRKEINDIVRERDILRAALRGDSDKVRELTLDLEQAQERVTVLEELLNNRSDNLARLETSHREHLKTIQAQEQTIEHLKREYDSRMRVHETEREVLDKKLTDLEHELRLRRNDSTERLIRERTELIEALVVTRDENNRLREQSVVDGTTNLTDFEELKRRLVEAENTLAERQARINALELANDIRGRENGIENSSRNAPTDGPSLSPKLLVSLEGKLREAQEKVERTEIALQAANSENVRLERSIKALEGGKDSKTLLNDLHIIEAEKKSLAMALSEAEAGKERLRAQLTEAKSELARLADVSAEVKILRSNLAEETKKREEADRICKHHTDMIELAEREMINLQERLSHYEDLDQQRRTVLLKYQTVKEEMRLIEERLAVKEEEIRELQAELQKRNAEVEEKSGGPNLVVIPSSVKEPSIDIVARLQAERDTVMMEKIHLERMNTSIEHEKNLLEKELQTVKEALTEFKSETGLRQHQALLAKAGHLIAELSEDTDSGSWGLLQPIKSIAAFLRFYKPAEVNVAELQAEYDRLFASLKSDAVFGRMISDPPSQDYSDLGSTVKIDGIPGDVCGTCRQPGHAATQCGDMSKSHDPMRRGGGVLPNYAANAGEQKPFSA